VTLKFAAAGTITKNAQGNMLIKKACIAAKTSRATAALFENLIKRGALKDGMAILAKAPKWPRRFRKQLFRTTMKLMAAGTIPENVQGNILIMRARLLKR
jgi:hypothetical protein